MKIIIEGVDRLGKSSLIEGLLNKLGYHIVLHYQKPLKLECYNNDLKKYQYESFKHGFNLLKSNECVIMDRFHLGEVVYSPRYRSYDGSYVYSMEDLSTKINLILLTTSDFSFISDDGESFDFSRKEEEQDSFIEAFYKSNIINKFIIKVNDGNKFRSKDEVLSDVLSKLIGSYNEF